MLTLMITLYSKQSCAPCVMTKRFLDHKGIAYEVRDIEENPDYMQEAYELSGMSIVPVIKSAMGVITGYQPQQLAQLI